MTWNPSDPLAIATIAGGSEVPDTVPKIFADAAWNHVFGVWANDGSRAGGERLPWILYQFYTDSASPGGPSSGGPMPREFSGRVAEGEFAGAEGREIKEEGRCLTTS